MVQVRLGTAHQGGGQQRCRACVAEKTGKARLRARTVGSLSLGWRAVSSVTAPARSGNQSLHVVVLAVVLLSFNRIILRIIVPYGGWRGAARRLLVIPLQRVLELAVVCVVFVCA